MARLPGSDHLVQCRFEKQPFFSFHRSSRTLHGDGFFCALFSMGILF
jgi:hypothetical protein